MKTREEIISDEQIKIAWGDADFDYSERRDLIIDWLKCVARQYIIGETAHDILKDLRLMSMSLDTAKVILSDIGLEYLLASPKPKDIEDWSKPVDGLIHVPDELDKLVNTFGHHYRVMAISGIIGENEMICRMVYAAQKFFNK